MNEKVKNQCNCKNKRLLLSHGLKFDYFYHGKGILPLFIKGVKKC